MNIKILYITLIIFCNLLFLNVNYSFSDEKNIFLYRYLWNEMALPCAGCHSANKASSIPSLCGLEEQYIYTALVDYKLGKRDNYLMQIIAKGYTDEKIKKLSKYFASKNLNRSCK